MGRRLICAAVALVLAATAGFGGVAGAYSRGLDPDPEVSRRQLEAQVQLFHDALVSLSVPSPERAVALWVQGDQMRNGVYKYAVACEGLRLKMLDEWGPPEKSFWIIGGSSPWLAGHQILSKTPISPNEIQYVVQYEWASSAGPEAPSRELLTLVETPRGWCVRDFVQSNGYHSIFLKSPET